MPAYIASKQTIAFEDTPRTSRDWLRLDCDESGVTIDRGGLYHLTAADCLELAAWLQFVAQHIPQANPATVPKRRGKKKGDGPRHTGPRQPGLRKKQVEAA